MACAMRSIPDSAVASAVPDSPCSCSYLVQLVLVLVLVCGVSLTAPPPGTVAPSRVAALARRGTYPG